MEAGRSESVTAGLLGMLALAITAVWSPKVYSSEYCVTQK